MLRLTSSQVSPRTTITLKDIRGVAFDKTSGHLFAVDHITNTVIEIDLVGTTLNSVVDSFSSDGGSFDLNAVAIDPIRNELYAVHFLPSASQVRVFSLATKTFTGVQWNAGQTLSGAAFDSGRDSLLLMENKKDLVLEFSRTGQSFGEVITGDAVNGDGQNLHYNDATGRLFVVSSKGDRAGKRYR